MGVRKLNVWWPALGIPGVTSVSIYFGAQVNNLPDFELLWSLAVLCMNSYRNIVMEFGT